MNSPFLAAPSPPPPRARRDGTMHPAGAIVFLATLVACSSGGEAGDSRAGNQQSDGGSTMLDLVRRLNDLVRQKHDIWCQSCPCGALHDVSPAVEQCVASVYDAHPTARDKLIVAAVCKVDAREAEQDCLLATQDCSAMEDCAAAAQSSEDRCDQDAPPLTDREQAAVQQTLSDYQCNDL
jgi:hypothetical protein